MLTHPPRKHRLSVLLTAVVFGSVLVLSLWPRSALPTPLQRTTEPNRSWPMFGGSVQRNFVNLVDRNILDDWDVPKGTNIKWTAKLGSRSLGGPVVAGGKVFIGTNNGAPRDPKIQGDKGVLMCFRESDGKFLWQAVHDTLTPVCRGQTVASTPAVDGKRLFYVSNRSELVCADVEGAPGTTDARILWRLDMIQELGVFPAPGSPPTNLPRSSPLVVDDLVFVVTGNGVDEKRQIPHPEAPSFIAVEKRTGKVRWKNNAPTARAAQLKEKQSAKDLMNRGLAVLDGQWASPAYAELAGKPQVIFPGGDGWLYSFHPADGKLLWKFDANPKDAALGERSAFLAAPVVVRDRLYIGAGQNPDNYTGVGRLWCLDVTKEGDVSPELVTDDQPFPPKTKKNPNSAVVWHFGGATSVAEAKELGRDFRFGRTISTVAVHDDLVYAAELAGYLHCLDAKTGQVYWTHDLRASIWASPSWVDGKVYLGTDDGDVWIPHGKEKKEPKRIEIGDPIHCASVVAVHGVLFVQTDSQLYAIGSP